MIELKEITELPTLMCWRAEVIENVFGHKPSKRLLVANRQYYREHIADKTHIAYVAILDGEEVGCGAMCLTDELPSPDNPLSHCAYLMNIYESLLTFQVGGHIFCMADIDSKPVECTIKLTSPEEVETLKEKYKAVGKPYNFSPTHWVSLTADKDIPDSEIYSLVKQSYDIISKSH